MTPLRSRLTIPLSSSVAAPVVDSVSGSGPGTVTSGGAVTAAYFGLKKREDWREIPFVTIDPADAKDHDDAVHAESDPDPGNLGGFILSVAIADVAREVAARHDVIAMKAAIPALEPPAQWPPSGPAHVPAAARAC